MPKFTVDLTANQTKAVVSRYGWTETITAAQGATVANPVTAREFMRAWLPNFLADEVFAAELRDAAKTASAGVTKPTIAPAVES
jgi:hypothetical protein